MDDNHVYIFGQTVVKQNRRLLSRRNAQIVALIVILFAFGLRLHDLTSVPISGDEYQTIVEFANLPLTQIFYTYHSNNHPLASAFAHLFSPQADHLFMLRWSIILVGMIALPFFYRLSTDLLGQKVGLLSLGLLAVSPVHMNYSVVVRGNGGVITATIISLYLVRKALLHNHWGAWFGFVTINVVIVYFHLYGVVAVWMQLGLVGLWLLWIHLFGSPASRILHKSTLISYGVVVLSLVVVHVLIAYTWTQEILFGETWGGEFDVWRDGTFSFWQETSPLVEFISRMTLWPPFELGFFIYLIFFIVGLTFLWRQQRISAVIAALWFAGPFIGIFLATQVIPHFYAYVRFLAFLLPTFLIIVAVGLITTVEGLSALASRYERGKRFIIGGLIVGFVVGLLAVITISVHWHYLYSNGEDWQGVANGISSELGPNDAVICEEGHGFDVPNKSKDYCVRMLDFLVPDLKKYTPHLQSSTNYIANYENILEQRISMLQPGKVWLVPWSQTPFVPGEFAVDPVQLISPPPPLSAFEPYPAWYFGSAVLVRVDSEATLLGNIHRALELLVQFDETSPANKARFYRSLAELEAVQGHKAAAHAYYNQSWAAVEQAGGQYPKLFLFDTLSLIERIPSNEPLPGIEQEPVNVHFDQSLCLLGFQISSKTANPGQTVEIALLWQVQNFVDKDYLYYLVLHNQAGESVGRIANDPFQRVYPTTWWWPGEQMVDRLALTVPPELAGQSYGVSLELADRNTGASETGSPLFQLRWLDGHWLFETQEIPQADCIGE